MLNNSDLARIWLQLTNFARLRCETPHRLQCTSTLHTIYCYVLKYEATTLTLTLQLKTVQFSCDAQGIKMKLHMHCPSVCF